MQKSSKSSNTQSFFRTHPVFTTEEFEGFIRARGSTNAQTRRNLLQYFHRQRTIINVRRGLYCSVPPGTDPESCPVDSYLLASKLAPDAVIAHHSALELHGRSYSVQNRVIFMSKRYPAGHIFKFRGIRFQSIKPPSALVRARREHVEIAAIDRSGHDVRVTTLERTFVDVLDRPKLAGGWEEVWKSLESIPSLNLEKVLAYSTLLSRKKTIAVVGYFLEQHSRELMVDDSLLNKLAQRRPAQPTYLDRSSSQKSGRLISRWNLIVPQEVIERGWEEPG